MTSSRPCWIVLALLLAVSPARAQGSADTLAFEPTWPDSAWSSEEDDEPKDRSHWLRAPFGDGLLTDPELFRERADEDFQQMRLLLDYNRVDPVRLGAAWEAQSTERWYPRLGARFEYAFGRERTLYGMQLEQPLSANGRFALGVSMTRRTDHWDLHQVDDVENSLALLFGRTDWRDYYEREGVGAYLGWRVPDFSTLSAHLRRDDYRSLETDDDTWSMLHRKRNLRDNPPVDEGEIRSATFRLERLARRTARTRAGFWHWIEAERAGGGLGGDYDYARVLADVRGIVRLSPATTLYLRGVGGHSPDGTLPLQKQFVLGGVDGLRAHGFASRRGDQMLLGQAEYVIGLWQLRSGAFDGGLHAIAFVDVGQAWFGDDDWSPAGQRFEADGGFGIGTSEDDLRVYFAKDLHAQDGDFVVTLRLQRPF